MVTLNIRFNFLISLQNYELSKNQFNIHFTFTEIGLLLLFFTPRCFFQLKKVSDKLLWTAGCTKNCSAETFCKASTKPPCILECCNATSGSCLWLNGTLNVPSSATRGPRLTAELMAFLFCLLALALLLWVAEVPSRSAPVRISRSEALRNSLYYKKKVNTHSLTAIGFIEIHMWLYCIYGVYGMWHVDFLFIGSN